MMPVGRTARAGTMAGGVKPCRNPARSASLNGDTDHELEDPETGRRHTSPIARDVVLVVIRARGEELCRLRIPTTELLGDRPYVPPLG
jgi:hypothetical protein